MYGFIHMTDKRAGQRLVDTLNGNLVCGTIFKVRKLQALLAALYLVFTNEILVNTLSLIHNYKLLCKITRNYWKWIYC